MIATLIRVLGDFDRAEEAMQDAFAVALEKWPDEGVPDNPGAWITRVARNKAIDGLRREQNFDQKSAALVRLEEMRAAEVPDISEVIDAEPITDDRLRLIFTCCHTALASEARVALTLKTLGGLTTGQVARAFLTSESTMAQRLVRAKRKIAAAAIPYRVPEAEQLPERLSGVLTTLYLIFNEGYLAAEGEEPVRDELASEAIRMTRTLAAMLPREPEVLGLLALMLLTNSRRPARLDVDGVLVPLEDQDRSSWDQQQLEEGLNLAAQASAFGPSGPYTVQAAIAACHGRARTAEETDWEKVLRLYGWLGLHSPGPVVELNRAAAVAMVDGFDQGLRLIDQIDGLDDYQPMHAVRADLLRRIGRDDEAAEAYDRAIALSSNQAEAEYLKRRRAGLIRSG